MKSLKILIPCLGAFCLFACKKPKPGKTQPPVDTQILVYQPCQGIVKSPNISNIEVSFKSTIGIKVLDANNNVSNFQGSPLIDNYSAGTAPNSTIPFGYTKTVKLPEGISGYYVNVVIRTLSCGTPIPNASYSPSTGGNSTWEADATVQTYPHNTTVPKNLFSQIDKDPC
jgi:hypothetical protein